MANMTFKASLLPSADNTYSLGSNDTDIRRWKINGFAGQPIEYIEGTQAEATGSWTGVTQDSELKEGKVIAYRLPYAGSGNASLTLTFTKPIGDANSGAIPVYAGNTRLTTHYPANSIMIMVYDGINWRTNPYYNTNTNTLLRTYAGSANHEYPLLAQNSAANATAAWTEYTSSYKDYYGVIPNSSATRATINLSTGHITVPGGITANLTGTAAKATADADGNNIKNTYATKASLEALDVNSPNSSGSTLQFIDTVSQINGKISATKKQVQNATSEQAGVVSTDTQTFSGDKTFNGLITTSHSATHKGVKVGDTYINASNGDLILQNNNAIRFGTDTWDYKEWAGLKYVHSTKTISLGLADGTIFTTSSGNEQANGTLNFPGIDKVVLTQNSGGLYKYYSSASTAPFLQVNSNNIDVSILKIDGNSPTDIRDSQSYGFNLKYIGTGDGANNTLRIYGDNSDGVDALATEWSGDGKVGISGTYNTDYNLYIHGTSYHNGNDTHAGNINPEATNTRSLGETGKRWSHLYIGTKDTYGSNVRPIWWNGGVPTEISYTANRLYYPSTAEAFTAGTHFVSDTKIAINSTSVPDETLYVNGTEKIANSLSINTEIDTNYKLKVNGKTLIDDTTASSSTNQSSQLIVSNSNSGNVALELWRNANASWQLANESGVLYLRNNYTTSKQSTYSQNGLTMDYNTSNASFAGKLSIGQTARNTNYQLYVNSSAATSIYLNTSHATASGSWNNIISGYAPNMVAGSNTSTGGGQAASEYNSGYLQFHYTGSGSTSNYIGLGLHGHDYLIRCYGTGNVSIGADNNNYKLYVNGTSCLNGNLYMPATSGIYTIGNKATYRMIRFIDNAAYTYGNGIAIGGGGPTIIGGGESADVMADHNGNNGSEIMYIGNDGNIDFYTNLQNGWDSGKHFYMDTTGHFKCPGYVYANYYNASCGVETPSNASYWVYSNSDGFFRKSSLGNLFNLLRDNGGDSRWVTLATNQNITGTKTWGSSGAGGQLNGAATNGGINSIRIGDDVWLGDCNAGGIMGMKSTGNNCGFYFYNSSGTKIGHFYCESNTRIRTDKEICIDGISAHGQLRLVQGNYGVILRNDGGSFWILPTASGSQYGSWAKTTVRVDLAGGQLFGAAWNDYAEYRKNNEKEKNIQQPGKCVKENGDGTLSLTTKRLERGCEIISDTFGFAIGQDKENGYDTPIASSGRVLAYPYEPIEEFASHIGYAVCSGPNGTVSIMTDEEEEKYPSRIIGTISEIPTYEVWGTGNVKVDGRVWIRIR